MYPPTMESVTSIHVYVQGRNTKPIGTNCKPRLMVEKSLSGLKKGAVGNVLPVTRSIPTYSEISTIETRGQIHLARKYKHAILRIWYFDERCHLTQFF
jgi:hypothetical protein